MNLSDIKVGGYYNTAKGVIKVTAIHHARLIRKVEAVLVATAKTVHLSPAQVGSVAPAPKE